MKIKTIHIAIGLIINTFLLPAQQKQENVQKFINSPAFKHASIGICVKDFSGKTIISHNAKKAYTPASILKVVTTATALETLGKDYRYKTILAKNPNQANQLIIHGYGDPTLGTKHLGNSPDSFLTEWTPPIKKAFETEDSIHIYVVDNFFGYEAVSRKWIHEDIGNYYAAGAYGISIFDNSYQLFLNTMRQDTCPVIIRTKPAIDISFLNMLKLNNTGKDNGYILGEPFSFKRTLIGDVPSGKKLFSIKGDIPDPGLHLGKVLAKKLKEEGIKVESVKTSFKKYYQEMHSKERETTEEDTFHIHYSYPLKEIIKETNVRSNNHYAEHLIRTVGRSYSKDIYSSPLSDGINQTKDFWKKNQLNTNALFMYDGCGLAPSNAVSAEFICDLLLYMQNKSNNAEVFLASLPEAGKTGTVRFFLKGTRLEGKIFVKSGSIENVQCYTGYYINGEIKYVFTVMVNNYNSPRNVVVKAIQNLLLDIF